MARSKKEGTRRRLAKKGRRSTRVLMVGATAGATFTYLFDPDQGRRRRALLRDKTESARHDIAETTDIVMRDGRNRARGLLVEVEKLSRGDRPSDARVHHEVRAAIAATSRHPGAVDVRVVNGQATLAGPILADEVSDVLAAVQVVPGVEEVNDLLSIHDEPGDVPDLQGEGRFGGPKPELLQQHWAPAPRAVAGAAGGVMLAYGFGRRGLTGLAATAGGGLLLARAISNLPVRQLTGVKAGPAAVQVDKSIEIDAPVEEVWAFWDDYTAFPTFMSHVLEVQEQGEGQSRWKVDGPLGTTVVWDAEVTERRPNEALAWRSRPGTPVQHIGKVAFEAANGGSRVHVRLSYNPAVGAAGHTIARLLGTDPKKQLDDDLLRMKTMIETGQPPHDAAQDRATS